MAETLAERVESIHQRLTSLITTQDFERGVATLASRAELEGRVAAMVPRDELQQRLAALVRSDTWTRGRLEDRDVFNRVMLVQAESFRDQVRLIAEGHAVLAAGIERMIDRFDKLERDLTSLIMTAYHDLDRRKQDKPVSGPSRR